MKRVLITMLIVVALLPLMTIGAADGVIPWDGNGAPDGGTVLCDSTAYPTSDAVGFDIEAEGIMQWNLANSDGLTEENVTLMVNGVEFDAFSKTGSVIKFFTPYYEGLTPTPDINVTYIGPAPTTTPVLTISHYCEDGGIIILEVPEFPLIAVPIAAIVGLAFFFQRRKE
ncbi:PEF-CTERM sorting domain-containing protein [Methanolobus mangrovi]|uniref:PEF-CTERM sorting domain-containing protein n=1 Tax=Methanolobus mangrovi TaxID=3072977 RepID=A0AA51UI86_9EURY|nr:PEF-CTERM sorting domain-containing protein [Methanolobus mangrovi]WMW22181.1 PEF-CTERM sorting domain-containing protein [Methanolobus mangrovi]